MIDSILTQLANSRRDLLDLGLRNPLISFKTRKSKVDIIDEISEKIYEILVIKGKKMKFLPLQVPLDESNDELIELMKQETPDWSKWFMEDDGKRESNSSRYTDSNLQTNLSPVDLHSRLLSLHNGARTYLEEQGVNVLYLALGFLHWTESGSSSAVRRAPLVLIPVELKRSDAREKFSINYNLTEIGTNRSLIEKFRSEYNLIFPEPGETENFNIIEYFNQVEKSIMSKQNWKVVQNEMVLSYFSFGKFVMYEDLDPKKWPDEQNPAMNGIISGLLGDSLIARGELISEHQNIDLLLDPTLSNHVVDADSSQTRAIMDIANGHNLVIQGPPGTGKSQTITNIIADSIYRGKKVLFVAEKMAALEVVKLRLDKVGLGDAILELHSHKANKVALIEELRRTLNLGTPHFDEQLHNHKELKYIQDLLNKYVESVNKPILNSGISPVEVIGKIIAILATRNSSKRIDFVHLVNYTEEEFSLKKLIVDELMERLQRIGVPSQNPFFGCDIEMLLPSKQTPHITMLKDACEITTSLINLQERLKNIKLNIGMNFSDYRKVSEFLLYMENSPDFKGVDHRNDCWLEGKSIEKTLILIREILQHEKHLKQYIKAPKTTENIDQIIEVLKKYGEKWWKILIPAYRKIAKVISTIFLAEPPKDINLTITVLRELKEYQEKVKKISKIESTYHKVFGKLWSSWRSKLSEIEQVFAWLRNTHTKIKSGETPEYLLTLMDQHLDKEKLNNLRTDINHDLSQYEHSLREIGIEFKLFRFASFDEKLIIAPFQNIQSKLQKWIDDYSELNKIALYNVLLNRMRENDLGFLRALIEDWPEASHELTTCFELSWYTGLLDHSFVERRALNEFDKNVHRTLTEKFKDLDKQTLVSNQIKIAKKHWEGLPKYSSEIGQIGVLKREMNKKRRIIPIRRLIAEAGDVIRQIKPVFMMGPLSVASFLPQGFLNFDLVIFDEASQVKPVDAFGAILRGNQVVVIGDSKQLPPTTFFETMSTDNESEIEDYSVTSETESILGLFLSKNAPERMLNWHYRSRHDSLIAISNREFYDNKLVVFPSPGRNHIANGLSFKYLPDTSYDRGKSRANTGETFEVAKAILHHIRTNPKLTLGVVAFSTSQRDAILLQVERIRRENPGSEFFFNEHNHEPFFVKNLENVQGDERDVILISIGYGKTGGGETLNMNFGPLNKEGGERRLNVLISRARMSCIVFANFKAEDMNIERTTAKGVHALKSYLRFAETGILDEKKYSESQKLPPFENYISKRLIDAGYKIVPQIGFSGYKLDIGILDQRDDSQFVLAIECDGKNFSSAHSARDRERLRGSILENLGWNLHRVWSVEWFRNENAEWGNLIKRIKSVQENLEEKSQSKKEVETLSDMSQATVLPYKREVISKNVVLPKKTYPGESIHGISDNIRMNEIKYIKFDERIPVAPDRLPFIRPIELAPYIRKIVMIEGPVHSEIVKKRIANSTGVAKVGVRISNNLDTAIKLAIHQKLISYEDLFLHILENPVRVRDRSAEDQIVKTPEYIPPSEIKMAIFEIIKDAHSATETELIHQCFRMFGFLKVTAQMKEIGAKVLNKLLKEKVIQKDLMGRFFLS